MKPLFHKQITYIFLAIILLLNISQSITLPLIDDEAYYWVWSQHLDFGFYDHPPMVALFSKVGYAVFNNILGIRLLSIISNLLFFLLWIKILQPKTDNEKYLFLGVFGSTAIFQGLGFISTPDAPLLLFCSFFIWRWKEFISSQNFKNSLLLGLSMALAMYSKYHSALFILLAILPFLFKFLKNKWFYLSLIFALLLYTPHLYWQYNHEWPSVYYHLYGRNKKAIHGFPFGEWLLGFLTIANPLLLYFYVKCLKIKLGKNNWIVSLLWIVIGGVLFFGIIAFTRRVQPQWNLIIYIALIPLVYLYFKNKKNNLIIKLSFIYMGIILLVRILSLFPFIITKTPMYQLKEFVLRVDKVNKGIAVFERYQKASLYNFYTKKPSVSLQVYTHRYSQYDLWNSEKLLQNKQITFFGLEQTSENYVLDEDNKKEFYKTVNNFHSFPEISCIISPDSISNRKLPQSIKIIWKNPYNKEILISPDSDIQAGILYTDPRSLEPKTITFLNESIKIPAKSSITTTLPINIPNLEANEYKGSIIIKPFGLSGKIISNEFYTLIQ